MSPAEILVLAYSSRSPRASRACQGIRFLEEHGDELHMVGKSARLIDRVAELLADGNLKVGGAAIPST